MNRRRFLGLVGGSSAITFSPSFLRAQTLGLGKAWSPSNRLNVAFIGLGGQAQGHFEYVLNEDSLQVVGLCDVDKTHLERARLKAEAHYAAKLGQTSYTGIRCSGDFRDFVSDPGVDILFNSTPDHWHALPTILAARAGKDIYCEKPLSRTPEEGFAMVEAVRRAGVVCQIGSQQRSSNEFQRTVEVVRNGLLGKIHTVKVGLPGGGGLETWVSNAPQSVPETLDYEMWTGPSPLLPFVGERTHWNWRWCYAYAGGQVTDWINHHYDIAQLALGVSDQVPVLIKNAWADFHKKAIYDTAVRYHFEAQYAGGQSIDVSSENEHGLFIEGTEGWVKVTRGSIQFSSKTLRNLPIPCQNYKVPGGLVDHRRNFIECVRARTTPRSPIDQAHKTAMAAHLANAAFRSGLSELRFDPAKNRIVGAPSAERFMACNYRSPWHLPKA